MNHKNKIKNFLFVSPYGYRTSLCELNIENRFKTAIPFAVDDS